MSTPHATGQAPARRFENLEHTADLAIRAYGATLPEVFANAAYGMFAQMADLASIAPSVRRRIELWSLDQEGLLVDWLNELLYWRETADETYAQFEVRQLSPRHLRAVVRGGRGVAVAHPVKAATFHGLKIEETPEGYAATIVFDV
jgi:SHS2 domain-containing protein